MESASRLSGYEIGMEINYIYTYGTADKLMEVIDDDGRFFRFRYDQCGLLVSVEDQAGRKYTYQHDEETQHLVHVTTPPTTDHPESITRIYHYEQPFAFPELRHNILRIEDGEGCVYLENEYEQDPALLELCKNNRTIVRGFPISVSVHSVAMGAPANPIFINIPAVQVEVINPDFGLETYTFNYRGDLIDHRWRLNKDKSSTLLCGNMNTMNKEIFQ